MLSCGPKVKYNVVGGQLMEGQMRLISLIFVLFFPAMAIAQIECGGTLEQKDFYEEIGALNKRIQKDVITYRKLQSELPKHKEGSAEHAKLSAEKDAVWAKLQKQKTIFKQLNQPHFPRTDFNVYGAACNDTRWINKAKQVLAAEPEHLGKRFHVWLDAGTREVQVAQQRPNHKNIAK